MAAKVRVYEDVDADVFATMIKPAGQPAVIRGAVAEWPAVRQAAQSPEALCAYLGAQANDTKVQFWTAQPDLKGRFSFRDDLLAPNHTQRLLPFAEITRLLLRDRDKENGVCHYAGGVPVPAVMPGILRDNSPPFIGLKDASQISLWIGNQTRTAAHWDLPQNLACVVAGRRRFTLFPIDQIANLYITPLDLTLAGQPTSLVDFHKPDFEKFPGFAEAVRHAVVADLAPGDVLYIPSLWFHHVESIETFGAMINFWWREGPTHVRRTTPLIALMQGLLSLRDMPETERVQWRVLFDHFLFSGTGAVAHIPPHARGLLGEMTPANEMQLRRYVIESLGGKAGF